MKRLTSEQRRQELEAIAAISEDQIDTSEIPELTLDQMRRGVRGQLYRPIKKPVTMRLDADVIDWLKQTVPVIRPRPIVCYARKCCGLISPHGRVEGFRPASSGRQSERLEPVNVSELSCSRRSHFCQRPADGLRGHELENKPRVSPGKSERATHQTRESHSRGCLNLVDPRFPTFQVQYARMLFRLAEVRDLQLACFQTARQ